MSPDELMAKALEAAKESETTVAWLNIAADALANAVADDTLTAAVRWRLLQAENFVLMSRMMLRGGQ